MSDGHIHKEMHYTNGEITIVWKPWLCEHSKRCWRELPEVFHPMHRPWITPDKSDSETIINQVMRCPSGALSIQEKDPKNQDNP